MTFCCVNSFDFKLRPQTLVTEILCVRTIGRTGLSTAYYAVLYGGQSGIDTTSIERTLRFWNGTAGPGQLQTFTQQIKTPSERIITGLGRGLLGSYAACLLRCCLQPSQAGPSPNSARVAGISGIPNTHSQLAPIKIKPISNDGVCWLGLFS